jgi:flavin reductase (DIM6/NTAB) family NADH-FMN oxidoreductase RutF
VATTVSAFMSLSLEPPLVLLALGANANILPFLKAGEVFGISILSASQRRLATIYADSFPVGRDPFSTEGVPLVHNALVALACIVKESRPGGDHTVIIAGVQHIAFGAAEQPLIRYNRGYHGLQS